MHVLPLALVASLEDIYEADLGLDVKSGKTLASEGS